MRIISSSTSHGVTIGPTDGTVIIMAPVSYYYGYAAVTEPQGVTANIYNLSIIGDDPTDYGVGLYGSGTLTNGALNVRDAQIAGDYAGVACKYGTLKLNNYGTITGRRGVYSANGGSITNGAPTDATALIAGESVGVTFSGGGPATIANFGTITGSDAIQLYGSSGVIVNGSASVTQSTLAGDGSAIKLAGAATVTVKNFGTLSGAASAAVYANSQMTGLKVTNGSATSTGALITGASGILGDLGACTVANFGTIQSDGSSAGQGFGVVTGGGIVTNGGATSTSALIEGNVAGVYLNGAGTLTNFGRVTGGVGALFASGAVVTNGGATSTAALIDGHTVGVYLKGAGTLTNFGRVTGGIGGLFTGGAVVTNGSAAVATATIDGGPFGLVFSGSASATVTNFGTISGSADAISFGDGADQLTVEAGSLLSGAVIGGGGSDTTSFAAGGTHAIGKFSGFEIYNLAKAAKNTLVLNAANFAAVTLNTIVVNGGDAGDTVSASAAGAAFSLTFNGGGAADSVFGGAGADTLNGGGGADRLNGGSGSDIMTGGAGDDVYTVERAGDQVIEKSGGGTDTVISTASYTLSANVEKLTLSGAGAISGDGNVLANAIVGNAAANIIRGAGGADTLSGRGGSDKFRYLAAAESSPGAGHFDHITDFTAGSGAGHDRIDLSAVAGATTIQGLITPASPSETPPATGLGANSIAWYQAGTETVVIANTTATANHVSMEIVLDGVTATDLSAAVGVNFIPSSSAARAAHFTQAIAGALGDSGALPNVPHGSGRTSEAQLLYMPGRT